MNKINSFTGEYNFLSNFAPCDISYEGITYLSAEAAFQAAKCADKQNRFKFQHLEPGEAKRLGKKINLRPDWITVKVDIMREIIQIKFSSNSDFKEKLLKTEDAELIEGNTWHDNFWGSCECDRCNHKPGKNMLGNLLMEYRKEIKGCQTEYKRVEINTVFGKLFAEISGDINYPGINICMELKDEEQNTTVERQFARMECTPDVPKTGGYSLRLLVYNSDLEDYTDDFTFFEEIPDEEKSKEII